MSNEKPVQRELDFDPPTYLNILRKYKDADPTQVLMPDTETGILVDQEPKTLETWRNQGRELSFVKLGRKVRYRLSDVLEYRNRVFNSTREALTRDRSAGRAR